MPKGHTNHKFIKKEAKYLNSDRYQAPPDALLHDLYEIYFPPRDEEMYQLYFPSQEEILGLSDWIDPS